MSSVAMTARALASEAQSQSPAAVMAFNILSSTGFLLLLAILATAALARTRVYRVSTWYTYICAWMVFCITPFPVLGHQTPVQTTPPGPGACLASAAVMYASRPYAGFGTLALLLHLYMTVSTRLKCTQIPRYFVPALIIFPPVSYLGVVIGILIAGLRNPSLVTLEPGGFYCHLDTPAAAVAVACLISLVGLGILTIEILTFLLLRRHWRAFRELQHRQEPGVSLSIILRVAFFALLPFIGLVLSFMSYIPKMVTKIFVPYNIVLACLPVAAALIFGSQSDIVDVWLSLLGIQRSQRPTTTTTEKNTKMEVGIFTTIQDV